MDRKVKLVFSLCCAFILTFSVRTTKSKTKPVASNEIVVKIAQNNNGIFIFNKDEYFKAKAKYPIDEQLCKKNDHLDIPFHVCTYSPKEDIYVSASIQKGRGFEPKISKLLAKMLDAYGNNTILVDMGGNIGVHTLYAATLGYKVFCVEPQIMNLVKVFHSSTLDKTNDFVELIGNTVDGQRRDVVIRQAIGNIGASYLSPENNPHRMKLFPQQPAKSVLMSDIFEHVARLMYRGKKLNIIVKIDIEFYECRAFLGSREVFNDERFNIPYIIQEWKYAARNDNNPEACPSSMVREMADFLDSKDYSFRDVENLSVLDPNTATKWVKDVVLSHKNAIPVHN